MRTAMIVLGVSLLLGCGDITVPLGGELGGNGESCTKKSDCLAGLGCFDLKCGVASSNTGGESGENENCQKTADCITGLKCIDSRCTSLEPGTNAPNPCGIGDCPANWSPDGICDPTCNCDAGNWDGGDCSCGSDSDCSLNPDTKCINEQCTFPAEGQPPGDEPCFPGLICDPGTMGNGECDEGCNCQERNFDGEDCLGQPPQGACLPPAAYDVVSQPEFGSWFRECCIDSEGRGNLFDGTRQCLTEGYGLPMPCTECFTQFLDCAVGCGAQDYQFDFWMGPEPWDCLVNNCLSPFEECSGMGFPNP